MESTSQFLPFDTAFFASPFFVFYFAAFFVVFVVGSWSIFARTGQPASLGFLMFLPGVNLILFLLLAFGRGPIKAELRDLRRVQDAARKADRSRAA
jgi:hypothetical protein